MKQTIKQRYDTGFNDGVEGKDILSDDVYYMSGYYDGVYEMKLLMQELKLEVKK